MSPLVGGTRRLLPPLVELVLEMAVSTGTSHLLLPESLNPSELQLWHLYGAYYRPSRKEIGLTYTPRFYRDCLRICVRILLGFEASMGLPRRS